MKKSLWKGTKCMLYIRNSLITRCVIKLHSKTPKPNRSVWWVTTDIGRQKSEVNQKRHWNFDLFNFPLTHHSWELPLFFCWLVNLSIMLVLVMNMVVVKKASVWIQEVSTENALQDMHLFYLPLANQILLCATCPSCFSIVIGGI